MLEFRFRDGPLKACWDSPGKKQFCDGSGRHAIVAVNFVIVVIVWTW